jgi:hypothetical protein
MKPALLFTYYRNPETCRQRLLWLRHLNPDLPIHGLFSGEALEYAAFAPLEALFSSHFVHPPASPEWLWSNYDLVISRWFLDCGQHHPFDWLWVHSWDLLLLDPLHHFVPRLDPRQVLLPGLRPLHQMDEQVLDPLAPIEQGGRWSWLNEPEFARFHHYWQRHHAGASLWCEVSPFGVLGRWVCQRYAESCWSVPGHNEYRFPSLAGALGAQLLQGGFGPEFWSLYEPDRKPWTVEEVLQLARRPAGQRLCHPFYYPLAPQEMEC